MAKYTTGSLIYVFISDWIFEQISLGSEAPLN